MAGKPDYWKDVAEDISRIPVEVELDLEWRFPAAGYVDIRRKH